MHAISNHSTPRPYRAGTLAAYALAVERVILAMRAHVSAPLSLGEMAEIACLSPFHFTRVFRSLTGLPPGEFLAALRLDAARRLLLTTSLSVTDVCFDLGYASLGSFTARFKQLVGLSPQQLRHLADAFEPPALALRGADTGDVSRAASHLLAVHGRGVAGSIAAPGHFAGLIFVGLFPRCIPQERPVACATRVAPGTYWLDPVPDGRYYLLAAAIPRSASPLSYLLPATGMLVGTAERPVIVRGGRATTAVDLNLRPLDVADPPILGVFPPLLATPAAARARAAL